MKLRSLYKRTKTSAIQVCNISTEGDSFTVEFGQLDGKLQTKTTKCFPKNMGKSNESTSEGQAFEEANSKWDKKVKSGYSVDIEAPVTVQLPRRVKKYQDHKNNVVYPAYSTNKLNGINGTYWLLSDGTLRLTSRGGELYPPIPHLEDQVKADMAFANTTCINCELYIHGYHLQDISSAVKKTKEISKLLTFNPFELPLVDLPYEDKVDILNNLSGEIVITEVHSEHDVDVCYAEAMNNKYEGTVIYNKKSTYKFNERSSDVYKYKETVDAEFKVASFTIDKNGHTVYVCEVGKSTFKVKRKGTAESRLADAAVATSNIGKWLNVEFEMLSKVGLPLKPVGNGFRLCDENGKPLE